MSTAPRWLMTLAARLLPRPLIDSALCPTLADIDHEVRAARGRPWRQRVAVARGSLAILRLVVQNGTIKEIDMRRIATIAGLGALGSVLFLTVSAVTRNGYAHQVPLFATLVLTPLVLRSWSPAQSYRETFLNCLAVTSILMGVEFFWARAGAHNGAVPWHGWMLMLLALVVCTTGASAVAAAIAWNPTQGTGRRLHERLNQALAGSAAFTICWIATYAGQSRDLLMVVGVAFVLAAQFAAVAIMVSLPLLARVGRRFARLSALPALPLTGAALFPLPFLLLPTLHGELAASLHYLSGHPAEALRMALPYMIAGAVLGWVVRRDLAPEVN